MQVTTAPSFEASGADVLAVAVSGEPAAELGIAEALEAEGFRPDAGAASLVQTDGRLVAAAGLGDELDADAFRTAAAAVARLVRRSGKSVAWLLDESQPVQLEEQARAVVDGIALGGYDPG
ncbi:MAG TPA: M17 family peptidase N-terminal domain-containing protein, partial [Gaiellaceae bacterium]|nr:M17 family peptidase N-terminal domain-containing protein [Gaiellaceae bacterium]